jgi:GT2 family glycosyltransferase
MCGGNANQGYGNGGYPGGFNQGIMTPGYGGAGVLPVGYGAPLGYQVLMAEAMDYEIQG